MAEPPEIGRFLVGPPKYCLFSHGTPWPVFLVPPPRSPILTAGQERRRIERLQKRIASLEAFDHQKMRKRSGNPEVVTLEAAIDEALSSAFGYGTPAYMRYNLAAKLDPGPSSQMTRFAGPPCVQLVDQQHAMRRLDALFSAELPQSWAAR